MHSDAHLLDDEVPQESILNVTFFALVIKSGISALPERVRDCLFISVFGSWVSIVERKLQLTLNRICAWAELYPLNKGCGYLFSLHLLCLPRPKLIFLRLQNLICGGDTVSKPSHWYSTALGCSSPVYQDRLY